VAWVPAVGRGDQVPATEAPAAEDVATGAGVGSDAPPIPAVLPFGWRGAGILGESPHGIPPLGFAGMEVGTGVGSVLSIPAWDFRSGGNIVRAVSNGAGSRAGRATALISLPHPKQNL
jgi:hypothetical protein